MKIPKARKLPSGSWTIQLRIDGQSISITKDTEKAAVAEAVAIKAGIQQALKTPMSDKTLTAAIDEWISSNDARLSPSTVRGYRTIQRNSFPGLMRRRCSTITDKMIEQAINSECQHYSAKTVTNRWRFVQTVLAWATDKHYRVKLPQVVRPDVEFLDRSDLGIFLKAIHGTPDEIIALLALSSLRRSEIAALSWDNVDLTHRWIHVRGAMVPDENHKMIVKETNKNDTSRRDVPIITPLYEALQAVPEKSGRVVKLHPATMLTRINRACAAAGVPQVGCHGLRHSFASLCHMLDIPKKAAMEIGGWADARTMERIYTHVSRRDVDSYESAFTAYFEQSANGNANAK